MGKLSKESYVEVDYSDFSATAAAEAELEEEEEIEEYLFI